MRTETTTRTLYKFNELSDEAKEKAVSKLYDINVNHDWWEDEFACFKDGLKQKGVTVKNIYFTGFSSQGDGACFTTEKIHCENITYWVYQSGRYYHENTMKLEYEIENGVTDEEFNLLKEKAESFLEDCKEQARELYRDLESTYNYLTSEAAIIETIEANDYEFTEEGKLV
jgi:hypothetical protein